MSWSNEREPPTSISAHQGSQTLHYNLARIRELEGDELNAKRHLRQYQRLVELELF